MSTKVRARSRFYFKLSGVLPIPLTMMIHCEGEVGEMCGSILISIPKLGEANERI